MPSVRKPPATRSRDSSTQLGWKHLKAVDVEELAYHLLNEIGYINVDWRKGTSKDSTTPDAGRDLEADVRVTDPDGDEHLAHWFVQVKHRAKTINQSDFRDAVDWATAQKPAVLLLVTSGHLSNPAKRWIDEFQREQRPVFRMKCWERPKLERLIGKYPVLQERFFPQHLFKAKSEPVDPIAALNDALRDPLATARPTPTGSLLREIDRLRRDVDKAIRM